MLTYPTPRRARYTPIAGKLKFRVSVLSERHLFGRHEYLIRSPTGEEMLWVTAGQDGQQLQFEEGE